MKREELRAISGLTDDQVTAIMTLAGTDAQAAQAAKADLQSQVSSLQTQLKTAQDGLKAFEGIDVTALQSKVTELQTQLTEQAAEYAFSAKLRKAIREAGALDEDDVLALLPGKDALRKSQNQDSDILAAVKAYAEAKPAYFQAVAEEPEQKTAPRLVVPKSNPPAGGVTLKEFAAYDSTQRMELKKKDPALFSQLVQSLKKR